jgi:uncharacterized protein (TIGR00269 family)
MPQKCTLCRRRDAVYVRQYSGERLCAKCFCLSIEDKVRAAIAKYEMLRFDDRISVGVSGGKDSMALLHILAKLEKLFPRVGLAAVTVDEGIRGYRDEALRIAERGCRRLGVEHVVVSFKDLFGHELDGLMQRLREKKVESSGLTPCAYCGVLRRRALNVAAREWGATKLATAHNLDDETQTVLLNILHGDPLRIAKNKPVTPSADPTFVCRVKPFCEVLEKETTLYAYLRKIEFQTVPCPYASAALRNDVRAMLNRMEERHPGLKYTVYRSAERMWSSLEAAADSERSRSCISCGEPTFNNVCQPCKMLQGLTDSDHR